MKQPITLFALALALLGCIEEETRHTLYLHPDGSLTWTADEQQIRSELDDPGERRAEEAAFLEAARDGRHPVALGLDSFGPASLVTTVVRDHRPFHVVTTAELGPVARFADDVLWRIGVPGDAELVATGDRRTLTVTLWPDEADEDAVAEDDPVLALLDDWDRYRIVLTAGRFLTARGFDIAAGGSEATPHGDDAEREEGAPLVLSLSWTAE